VEQGYPELPESVTHIDDPYFAYEKKKHFGYATT
tara:strand:+ start:450 stop:551 length:102 start_codon:yes stop_codon:yes gene_type:complete